MNNKILISVAAGVLVVGGVVWAITLQRPNQATDSVSPSTSVAPSTSPQTSTNAAKSAATITYGSGGFSPATTTVSSGQSVTFTNSSSEDVQVDSDPHPIHTDDSDLNVGAIAPDKSVTVVLTKKGTFGIHNHLNPSDKGKITIQ